MRTTISINDALLGELKKEAAASGKPFNRYLEETLQRGLASKGGGSRQKKDFRVVSHPLQMKAGYRGQSMNQIYDQIEAEESAGK